MDGLDDARGDFFQLHRVDAGGHDGVGAEVADDDAAWLLPLETTRGDRLFIGLLSAAYLNLIFVGISGKLAGWLGLEADPSIWISFVLSIALLAFIMRKG